jgi:hypothetical protein
LREKALETARSGGVAMESSPSKIEERGAVHWLRREARASSDPPHGLPQPLAPMSHNDGSRSGDAGAAAHAAAAVALAARSSSGWRSRSGGRAGGCARLRDGDCGGRDGGGRKEGSGWLAVSHAVRLLDDVERQGFIENYSGIRISKTGRRFRIVNATVFNLLDETGRHLGQAATFEDWQPV